MYNNLITQNRNVSAYSFVYMVVLDGCRGSDGDRMGIIDLLDGLNVSGGHPVLGFFCQNVTVKRVNGWPRGFTRHQLILLKGIKCAVIDYLDGLIGSNGDATAII